MSAIYRRSGTTQPNLVPPISSLGIPIKNKIPGLNLSTQSSSSNSSFLANLPDVRPPNSIPLSQVPHSKLNTIDDLKAGSHKTFHGKLGSYQVSAESFTAKPETAEHTDDEVQTEQSKTAVDLLKEASKIIPDNLEQQLRTVFLKVSDHSDSFVKSVLGAVPDLEVWVRCKGLVDAEDLSFGFARLSSALSIYQLAKALEYIRKENLYIELDVPRTEKENLSSEVQSNEKNDEEKAESHEDGDSSVIDQNKQTESNLVRLDYDIFKIILESNTRKWIIATLNPEGTPEEVEGTTAESDLPDFPDLLNDKSFVDLRHNIQSLFDQEYNENGLTRYLAKSMPGESRKKPVPSSQQLLQSVDDSYEIDQSLEGATDIPPEQLKDIIKEIKSFRTQSKRYELAQLAKEQEAERRRLAEVARQADEKHLNRVADTQGLDDEWKTYLTGGKEENATSDNESDTEGGVEESSKMDEMLEIEREENEEDKMEEIFLREEMDWLAKEKQQLSKIERMEQFDRERADRAIQEKRRALVWLSDFDDSKEEVRNRYDYYKDHTAWVRARASYRSREMEFDSKVEAELSQKEEKASLRAKDFLERQSEELAGTKRTSSQMEGQTKEKSGTTTEPINMSLKRTKLSEAEKTSRLQKLAEQIPTDEEAVFAYNIKWEYLDQDAIDNVLKPFIMKKIVEVLEMEEEDLQMFIVDFIVSLKNDSKAGKPTKNPTELVSELEQTLDEDAKPLTLKVWRMLILESERRAQGLI